MYCDGMCDLCKRCTISPSEFAKICYQAIRQAQSSGWTIISNAWGDRKNKRCCMLVAVGMYLSISVFNDAGVAYNNLWSKLSAKLGFIPYQSFVFGWDDIHRRALQQGYLLHPRWCDAGYELKQRVECEDARVRLRKKIMKYILGMAAAVGTIVVMGTHFGFGTGVAAACGVLAAMLVVAKLK